VSDCASPHPIRASDGLAFADDLEIVASDSSDVALRCRKCGKYFWTVTDVGGKYEYVDAWELDAALARAALVEKDARALARLLVGMNLPKGPVWTSPRALADIFRALTPHDTDATRAAAIEAALPRGLWATAARALAKSAETLAKQGAFPFSIDLRTGKTFTEWFEVGEALVLFTGGPELLRLEARGLVQLPFASPPRLAAHARDRALVTAQGGFVVLDSDGNAIAHTREGATSAIAFADGWITFDAEGEERFVELRLPDGVPRKKLRRRFGKTTMPEPLRLREGFVLTDAIDSDGVVQALTLVSDDFATLAQSTIEATDAWRMTSAIDDASFWATTDKRIERWVRKDAVLERVQTMDASTSWPFRDLLVVDTVDELVALSPRGETLWRIDRHPFDGATYAVDTRAGLFVHRDSSAILLSRNGKVKRTFVVDSPDVRVARDGTVYVKSLADLFVIAEDVKSVDIGLDASLETTFGNAAVLARDGTALVVTKDGVRDFALEGATFSVFALACAWVVSGDRVRGAPNVPPDARLLVDRIASRLAIDGMLGASVRALPTNWLTAFAIVLADGRAPVLVRQHVAICGISIEGRQSWQVTITDDIAKIVTEVARATIAWSQSKHRPTMCEQVLRACALLEDTFDGRWTLSIPGTPNPAEMWLHDEDDNGSIGIFPGRSFDEKKMLAGVALGRVLADRVSAIARELGARIEGRFARAVLAQIRSPTFVEFAFESDAQRVIARIDVDHGTTRVHAGVPGALGFDGEDASRFDDLAAAIDRMATTLTFDKLASGRRYRVRETVQQLHRGAIVRFDRLDDLDNHHGQAIFTSEDGRELVVDGDFSSTAGPLAETYRYLEELPE
jgi:hypothetical protein